MRITDVLLDVNDFPFGVLLLALLGLLLLSAFFSGSETALMTLNRYRLRSQAERGHRGAQLARQLIERPDRLIGLILLGNNFVNILASSLATILALRLGGEGAVAIAAGLLTFVILIFSEVAPKTLAALHPERLAYPAAFVYVPLLKVFAPLVWLINLIVNKLFMMLGVPLEERQAGTALSHEELRTVVNEASAMIPERSRDMLLAILDLEHATVEDIMIPRHEVEGLDLRDSEGELVAALKRANYARLPLFDGGSDNLLGVINARTALAALCEHGTVKERLRELASPPYFVPAGTPLYQQLVNFQHAKQRLALVVDEYGDFQGMIALADLLEEIVGEFTTDPADAFPAIHCGEDGRLVIDASISVRELNRALRWDLPTDGPKTLNGLILDYLETIPEPGTSFKLRERAFEIIQTDDKAVKTVKCLDCTPLPQTAKGVLPRRSQP